MGLFEYFSGRLHEYSSGVLPYGRGHFSGVEWNQVNPYECKWDFLNTFKEYYQ